MRDLWGTDFALQFYDRAAGDVKRLVGGEAQRRGLAEHGDVMRRGKRFMIPFCAVMLIALVLIVGVWNRASTFRAAYAQTAVFQVVMNWFDGIIIDRLWVGRSKIWRIEGMEGVPYVKPWKTVLIKRGLGTVLYLLLSPAFAAIALQLAKL